MNTEYILITVNNWDIRGQMNNLAGTELVGSQAEFICWHWVNPSAEDLATAKGLTGYIDTVQVK
jgi:hypothetical protein